MGLLLQMIAESGKCSSKMNHVPRPLAMPPRQLLTTIGKTVAASIFREINNGGKHYVSCMNVVKIKFYTAIQLAFIGS